jgi:broad specificity phosphatase PhoE
LKMPWQRIYLLRHGETEWNRFNLFRGRSDIELSERGRAQASAAAALLSEREISSIYSSPVKRAVETAEIVSQAIGKAFVEARELSDPDCGLWAGRNLDEARRSHPHEFALMKESPSQFRFPEGESVAEVAERISRFILRDLWDGEGGNLLLVTHNFIFQVFTMVVLGRSLDNLFCVEMDNGAISEFVRKGDRVVLRKLNENNHLESIRSEVSS